MKLDTRLPREQEIANSLEKSFDRKYLKRLLLEWIIGENHPRQGDGKSEGGNRLG
jgi:hypothetical protein